MVRLVSGAGRGGTTMIKIVLITTAGGSVELPQEFDTRAAANAFVDTTPLPVETSSLLGWGLLEDGEIIEATELPEENPYDTLRDPRWSDATRAERAR